MRCVFPYVPVPLSPQRRKLEADPAEPQHIFTVRRPTID